MQRIPAVGAAIALALVALAGCAGVRPGAPTAVPSSTGTPAASPSPMPSLPGEPAAAVDLLPTVWHVHGAAGADPATYLLFAQGEVDVLEPKGDVSAPWATQGDEMLAMVNGWSMTLGTAHQPTVPWLTAATRFRRTEDGWVLLAADGRTLATLIDDGPAPAAKDYGTTPEPVTTSARSAVADAVAGPGAGLGGGSVVGRWGVPGLDPAHASLTLSVAGAWSITGGCPSGLGDLEGSGDYRVLASGVLLHTDRPIGGVGCGPVLAHPPADSAALTKFWTARSVALQGDHLTLFDRAGTRIGTLTRLP